VGVAVVILLVFGLGDRSTPPQPGDPMPTFALGRLQGGGWRPELSQIALEDLLGQVIVVNFWASWCDPCRIEASDLEEAWQAYKGLGVVFVGIAYKDAATKAEQHISEFGVTYPNVQDPSGRVARAYGVTGVPETFVIAQDGTLLQHFIGVVTSAQLAGAIDPQLSQ
jgi:cytochrome c biogenesis protein CcmG/thiol:disulfide interchange protein DsbE